MLDSKLLSLAADKVETLTDDALKAAHERSHNDSLLKSQDGLSAHHVLAAELNKRGIACDHNLPMLFVSSTDVTKRAFEAAADSLPMDLVASLRQAFDSGDAPMASVLTMLGSNGYDMQVVAREEGDERTGEQMFADLIVPGMGDTVETEPEESDEMEEPEDEEDEQESEENNTSTLGRFLSSLAELLGVEKGYSFAFEDSLINRNKRRSGAKEEHTFKAGKYKTRDGRSRCLTCGGEMPTVGKMCNKQPSAKITFGKNDDVDKADTFTPPQNVQDEAQRALNWLKDGHAGSGFTATGRARAVQLANGKAVSMDTVRRMHSFLSRHSVDSQGQGYSPDEDGYPSAGRVAYAAWGGEPALSWVKGIIAREDKKAQFAKADERRFTLGPMYIPDREDAHGEWTDADELQQALWNYVRSNDRRIRLQHNRDVVAGEWVEVMTFPFAMKVPMIQADGSTLEIEYPANTVFMGIVWEPWAWNMVKEGKLRGLSIGGKAQRVEADIPMDEDIDKSDPSVGSVHIDVPMGAYPKKPKDKR